MNKAVKGADGFISKFKGLIAKRRSKSYNDQIAGAVTDTAVMLINQMIRDGVAAGVPASLLVHYMHGKAQLAAQLHGTTLANACPILDNILGLISRSHAFSDPSLFAQIKPDVSPNHVLVMNLVGIDYKALGLAEPPKVEA
jgi:hypothetical protein